MLILSITKYLLMKRESQEKKISLRKNIKIIGMEEGNKGYQRDLGREREMNETFLKMGKNKNENKKNEKLLLKICLFFETFYKMCKQKNENDYHKITIFLKE